MTELKNYTFDIPIAKREAETPAEIFHEDARIKKSCIPHPTPKATIPTPTRSQFYAKCGDTYKISLGYPMTLVEYRQLPSDDLKKVYINSMIEKYPGITNFNFSKMFGTSITFVNREFNRLEISTNGEDTNRGTSARYNREIAEILEKIRNGEMPRNLSITKNRKTKKLRRKTWKEIREMTPADTKQYIMDVYDQYEHVLVAKDYGELFGVSVQTVYRLFRELEIHFPIGRVASPSCEAVRDKFRNEMLAAPAKRGRPKKVQNDEVSDETPTKSDTNNTGIPVKRIPMRRRLVTSLPIIPFPMNPNPLVIVFPMLILVLSSVLSAVKTLPSSFRPMASLVESRFV